MVTVGTPLHCPSRVGTEAGLGWEPAVRAPDPHGTLPHRGLSPDSDSPSLSPRRGFYPVFPPLPRDELTEPHSEPQLFQIKLRADLLWGSEIPPPETKERKGLAVSPGLPNCVALRCMFSWGRT